ncbi:tetratricopeptide repeat-containing serine protease family protein [Desulfocurvus sp. DL9XJH121]
MPIPKIIIPAVLACVSLVLALAGPCRAGLSHFSHDAPAQADDARLRSAAEGGSAEAQYLLGAMLMVRAEQEELRSRRSSAAMLQAQAANWFHRAAGAGNTRARFSLGLMRLHGQGVGRDTAKALRWLEAAARDDDPDAQYVLGTLLAQGDGTRRDPRAALQNFIRAGQGFANQGRADWLLETARAVRAVAPGHPAAERMEQAAAELPDRAVAKARGVSMGTAWIAAPGFAVTNRHVVAGRGRISLVHADGSYAPATVAAEDADNDLVLLAVADPKSLPPALPLAQQEPGLGAPVFTVGFPEPAIMGASPKLATGRITGLSGLGGDERVFQISVPLAHGNSGGPLVNLRGEVVGVVQAMIDAERVFRETGALPQDVNYALRADLVRTLIQRAPKPERGFLDRLKSLVGSPGPAELPANPGTVETHAPSVQNSVLMVVAE